MSVAAQDTKELVVSVDQRDLESIKSNLGRDVRVMLPGRPVFASSIERVDPRATDQATEPRLCANSGPRFDAYVSLDRSIGSQIHAGQRCQVFFSATEQSLGSYFFLATSEWLKNKIELAVETATM